MAVNPADLYRTWAPPDSPWSRWAKPILFAELRLLPASAPAPEVAAAASSAPLADGSTAMVVDLPGADSVAAGLRLARTGYRPVPLFNGVSGPSSSPGVVPPVSVAPVGTAISLAPADAALVDVTPIMHWLCWGAVLLERMALPPEAPPAFLLDARRQEAPGGARPGRFDNRWLAFPQDFPSATFLQDRRIVRAILIQQDAESRPANDLAHVLRRWQEAGIALWVGAADTADQVRPLDVPRPAQFRALWYRALAMAGLRRNSAGGFGGLIPEPSSG